MAGRQFLSIFSAARGHRRVGPFFTDLGQRIARAWQAHDYARAMLPSIAEAELRATPVHREIDYNDLVEWVMCEVDLPYQQYFDSKFGEPPVTVYWHPAFHIEALFWTTATPDIHNHGFCGAFAVLAGSSLQTIYNFSTPDGPAEEIRLGALAPIASDKLVVGDVQQILRQELFIHSVFHLDTPSVTIVVRSRTDAASDNRYVYMWPHVAFDPTIENQQRTRRTQCLTLLSSIGSKRYRVMARDLLKGTDYGTAMHVLRQAWSSRRVDAETRAEFASIVQTRWGQQGLLLTRSCEDLEVQSKVVRLRAQVKQPDLRLLLGLLLSHVDWPSLRRHAQAYAPDVPPEDAVADWVMRLSETGVLSVVIDAEARGAIRSALIARSATLGIGESQWRGDQQTQSGPSTADVVERLCRDKLLEPLLRGHTVAGSALTTVR
jgi:hypothetical protein